MRRIIKPTNVSTEDHVYVVPTRKDYMKNRVNKLASWDDLYGKKKCYVCGEHFEEGDEYIAEASVKKRKRWVQLCRHASCDPANPPKKRRGRKAIEEEEDDGTRKIYTDVDEKIGETLLLGGKVVTIIDKDSDDEGDYIVVEEIEEEEEEDDID